MTLDVLKVIAVIIGEIVVGLATTYVTLRQLRSNLKKTQAEGELSLAGAIKDTGETLEGAWKELREIKKELAESNNGIRELNNELAESNKRIRELDNELVKYTRALSRAIKFVREKNPNETIPDFLLDTDPNFRKK